MVKIEWTNPHIWIYVDMKDEKGALSAGSARAEARTP